MLPRLELLLLVASCAAPAPAADTPPQRDLALQGTRWVMAIDGEAVSARAPTLEFSTEGRAGGFSGCNQWFAQLEQAHGGIRFHAVGMTRRACAGPAMGIENDFSAMLTQTRAAERDGDNLILFGEEGEPIARFTPTN